METNEIERREFIKYGLVSSLLLLTGCSLSKKKLSLRGVPFEFSREFLYSLSTDWEFIPIKDIQSKRFSYESILKKKTDLLVLNDGWISDLPFGLLREIKATNIRDNLSKQTSLFLEGLGENYKNRIFPIAVSPWVILFRNENSLKLKNKNSWEVIFSKKLTNQIVFPNSPYLLMSIAEKIGLGNDVSKIKSQAKSFDDRNAINWVVSGRAKAAVLPLSSCADSLIKDPRLSVLLPQEGSPLNWTVLVSPRLSSVPFPADWFDLLWGVTFSRRLLRKGFLPPTSFSDLRTQNIFINQKYQSIFLPQERIWDKCWSLPLLNFKNKQDLAAIWNNS